MNQNYFVLNRFVIEISEGIKDSIVNEIFSQDKNKLAVALQKEEEEFFIELCVTPGQSFINLRTDYSRAKKNTVNFFEDVVGKRVTSISIASDDRVIKLDFADANIYFAIRGKHTNVFFFSAIDDKVFKSSAESMIINTKIEFEKKNFIQQFNVPDLNVRNENDYLNEIKRKHPFLGSDVIKEVKARAKSNTLKELKDLLNDVLLEIKTSKPALFIDENILNVDLAFENFISIPYTKKEIYDDLINSQNSYFSKKYFLENKQKRLRLITKHIDRELKKVSSKINNLRGMLERGIKENEYNKFGNLLLINIQKIKSGMKEIELDDIYSSNEKVKVKLNPDLLPKKNVDYYFDKSKAEKKSFEKSKDLLKRAEIDFNRLKKIEDILTTIASIKELDEIMKELKIKKQDQKKEKEELKDKFKRYVIDGKYNVYVGKDSKNNDLLTTKFAKQNDLWFHARSVSGSHVILRIDNTKEAVPKNILKKTAALAAFHSKAKTAGTVPVVYTFKKYVVKKKGDPIGTVHLLKEDVLLVKPEIPNGCDYVLPD
jgi:predicted ribosome quality control (RQC) complex YloA/Tae2 family protein